MRWFMTLAYRGAPFHGWQVQPGEETVQGRLESALSTLVRRPVAVTGAGRTDTGVNAAFMVAHVDLPDELDPREPRFLKALNSIAGRDIAVKEFVAVAADAHARFDATERGRIATLCTRSRILLTRRACRGRLRRLLISRV